MKLSGWGRYPSLDAIQTTPNTIDEVRTALAQGSAIARGNGRAYGDSAINKTNTICMKRFNRFIKFDAETGLLIAQSGVLLIDVLNTFLPKGWFPRVTPGTKFVTLGGMVASDVHGKNHHKVGSFGNSVEWIDMMNASGKVYRCSRLNDRDLFDWTLGGMGLTGIILNVAFYLQRVETSWIRKKILPAKNIEEAIDLFEQTLDSTYSVAWIDCSAKGNNLGRSLVMLGEHARKQELKGSDQRSPLKVHSGKKIKISFSLPRFMLSAKFLRLFNALYFWIGRKNQREKLVNFETYFYPLDKLHNWNRAYGKRGFAQFQCVIPQENASVGIPVLLKTIVTSGSCSFLSVLKRFGEQESVISFPMQGYTLALDLPINERNLKLMSKLDEITIEYGGRFYLTKDSRLSATTLARSDQRIDLFKTYRKIKDLRLFSSSQSERLGL